MRKSSGQWVRVLLAIVVLAAVLMPICTSFVFAAEGESQGSGAFPIRESVYGDEAGMQLFEILSHRIATVPFNAVATVIFFLAITHSLLTSVFHKLAHRAELNFKIKQDKGLRDKHAHSMSGALYHILGEVEVVFGIWAVVLAIFIALFYDWHSFVLYVDSLSYKDPLFIIVIMTIASSRPIVKLFELIMWRVVKVIGDTLEAWWMAILMLSAFLSSFITGPAAMTVCAMLLSDKFYVLKPSRRLRYATLALLFVNISVGGAMTNFASPPVLMVASTWSWSNAFMFFNFGWKSIIAIAIGTGCYYLFLRKDFEALRKPYKDLQFKQHIQHRFISKKELEKLYEDLEQNIDQRMGYSSELKAFSFILKENIKELARMKLTPQEIESYDVNNAIDEKFDDITLDELRRTIPGLLSEADKPPYHDLHWDQREDRVPYWIMGVHVLFMLWTIANAHEPVLFLSGFLFYLGFYQVTAFYQNRIDLKPALLVGFFLAGLIVHGTLQEWWIAPILGNLPPLALNLASIILTSFNDNAAITYLSTLVPNMSDVMKYAVVSGAITGGGLTVIANAPNPIGQSILKDHFESGIEAGPLMLFALFPTAVAALIFYLV